MVGGSLESPTAVGKGQSPSKKGCLSWKKGGCWISNQVHFQGPGSSHRNRGLKESDC